MPEPVEETTPVPIPTVAIPGHAQDHVPPPGKLVSVVPVPAHKVSVPPIVAGNGFTVAIDVTKQPDPNE